ncbi:MAG: hypothetical protein WCH43_04615, partial [Verrucomicrobiota bacterium]
FGQQPLVNFPQDDAAWTVEVSYPGISTSNQPRIPRIQKVEIVRKNNIRRNRITWSNGLTTETWQLDSLGVQVFEDPNNHGVYVISKNDAITTFLISVNFDASSFAWINESAFKGFTTYSGKKCRQYLAFVPRRQFPGTSAPPPTPLAPVENKALIDETTLLPVTLDDTLTFCRFTFLPPPSEPIVMPEKLLQQLKQYQEATTPLRRLKNGR